MRFNNLVGEYLSYPKLFMKMHKANKEVTGEKIQYGNHPNQYLLFFKAEEASKKLVIFIHGGGWRHGTPEMFRFIGEKFSTQNYNTILLGYRHAPKNKYPNQAQDIFNGFNKAVNELNTRGINTKDIIVVGNSAGSHLGAVLLYNKEMQKRYNVDQSVFKGFCSISGPLAFKECINKDIKSLISGLLPINYDKQKADPYHLIEGDENIPVLCIHGQRDPLVEKENSIVFTNKINSYKNNLAKYYIETNKRVFHSNLAAKIFYGELDCADILYKWIESI